MKDSTLVSIDVFCQQHGLDCEVMISLHEFGLINIVYENDKGYIAVEQLGMVEKIITFHVDLAINKEGIEVIIRLLEQINNNLSEITSLKNQLGVYESGN